MQDASIQSPNATKGISPTSSTSSSFQDDASDPFGDHETDRSTSPERSIDGDSVNRLSARLEPRGEDHKRKQRNYGTPEMPRGNAQHPHISPDALTPRPPPSQSHPKHLPRAEKLPLTGYELLASRLSTTSPDHQSGGPYLRPMYRRFETLNHRLLLHLQDEICELEEQLHRLDTADTQNRRLRNAILPASRRAEYLSGGELQWHRTDILGKIGFKLEQYNHVLSSFRKTQSLPTPTLADIHEYRGYLATHAPIAEAETRFLDATDDLVCVGEPEESEMMMTEGEEEEEDDEEDEDEEAMATPMARQQEEEEKEQLFPTPPSSLSLNENVNPATTAAKGGESRSVEETPLPPPPSLIVPLSLALAAVVIVPILTFTVIPGFLGRMTVVLLVGLGVLGALIQGHVVGVNATRDFCVCTGVYGAVMAILAGIVS
ncbi:hypothetical protein F4809DRAFT_647820 [Biscogniauxia mediterranea]|nr:hypothetical protein F4809DRAFT_647820 [Biscogniauxia mediterranea]